GTQAADPAHDEVDWHARLRCAVQLVDDRLVDDRIELESDARGPTRPGVLGLGANARDESAAHVHGSDKQSVKLLLHRVAGEFVEESGEILTDLVIRGQQSEVFV